MRFYSLPFTLLLLPQIFVIPFPMKLSYNNIFLENKNLGCFELCSIYRSVRNIIRHRQFIMIIFVYDVRTLVNVS